MKKTKLRIVSAVLVLVMSMSSISFAAVSESIAKENSTSNAVAASATLIRIGGNYHLYKGVPSDFSHLNWSAWDTYKDTLDAYSVANLTYDMASAISTKLGGWWAVIGLGFLANDVNYMGTAAFFQTIVNGAPMVNGYKTSYAKFYESHASSASGSLQYSKVYVAYYSDSSYKVNVGTSDTLCLYAWVTGSKTTEK